MTEYNCSERLAIVSKFSYNYDNFNIKKENNMSVNESQIKNTTVGAIDDDDAVIFKAGWRGTARRWGWPGADRPPAGAMDFCPGISGWPSPAPAPRPIIGRPLIPKLRRSYLLPDGAVLEVNHVDEGQP